MTRYKQINNERIQFTAEEEAARDTEEAQAVIDQKIIDDAKAAAISKKASAKTKLKALGLDDAELKTLGL